MYRLINHFLFASLLVFSLADVRAAELRSAVQLCNFYAPETGPYCEVYILTSGNSVKLNETSKGNFQGKIQIQMAFLKGDSVINFDSHNLLSPAQKDSISNTPDFINVKRFPLPPGDYFFEIIIRDALSKKEPFTARIAHHVPPVENLPLFSDIILLNSFSPANTPGPLTKSGYDIVPSISDYYAEKQNELSFYSEWYNHGNTLLKDDKMILKYRLENADNKTQVNDFIAFKRIRANDVIPLLASFDITSLPSGNYNLVLEAVNAENKMVSSQKVFFQRSKGVLFSLEGDAANKLVNFSGSLQNPDSLAEYIRCLKPILGRMEDDFASNVLETKDLLKMQNFFYQFWAKRKPSNPQEAWHEYAAEVKAVQAEFATRIFKGYQTDRGRVYLKYGKPDVRDIHENDPGLYPYEIWQYYKVDNRSNRRFVFYNPELATNRWMLLHSDAIGERRDDRWQMVLQKRNIFDRNLDSQDSRDFFGNRIQENFTTPR
ncbi:MAG: GWxTD domain-containing protein [Bacteroidota bacterium]